MDAPRILAIDPGPVRSGFYLNAQEHGVLDNDYLLKAVDFGKFEADVFAMERMEARGMPLGEESLETVFFSGRLSHAWDAAYGGSQYLLGRRQIKLALCGSVQAKDANIRAALIDIYGKPGTKKVPGGTYGVKSHAWAAMAVWHVAHEIIRERNQIDGRH